MFILLTFRLLYRTHKQVTEKDIERVLNLRKQGAPYKIISYYLGISVKRVEYILKKATKVVGG